MRLFAHWRLIALILAAIAASPANAVELRQLEVSDERTIEVMGEASVSATPDFVRVTLGVTTTAKDAREATAANAKAVNDLIALLKADGISSADIQTSDISVSPVYASNAPNSTAAPKITGYSVANTLTVTIRDIPRLGALLDKAVEAGSNAVYGIAFGENDPGKLLDKARPLAFADAKRKAEIYAAAAGGRVGRLMELSEATATRPASFSRRGYAQAQSAAAPTPIEAGQDKLTVSISARFELTP